jgi:hypothetical protein
MECCHNDGNHANNKIGNVRWDTPSANTMDAIRHGTHCTAKPGEGHHGAKLTENDVREIRRIGYPLGQHADRLKVNKTLIGKILRGENWKHII